MIFLSHFKKIPAVVYFFFFFGSRARKFIHLHRPFVTCPEAATGGHGGVHRLSPAGPENTTSEAPLSTQFPRPIGRDLYRSRLSIAFNPGSVVTR